MIPVGKLERPWQHTDDIVRDAVQDDLLPDNRRVGTEPTFPESMVQHDDAMLADFAFLRSERSAEHRCYAQDVKDGVDTPPANSRTGSPDPVRSAVTGVNAAIASKAPLIFDQSRKSAGATTLFSTPSRCRFSQTFTSRSLRDTAVAGEEQRQPRRR